jgi:hypothetical protein
MRKRCRFGQFLEYYWHTRGYSSQTDLQARLEHQGYYCSKSAISKYVTGERVPPPEFIYHVKRCLNLNHKEVGALFHALVFDTLVNFLHEYEAVQNETHRGGGRGSGDRP